MPGLNFCLQGTFVDSCSTHNKQAYLYPLLKYQKHHEIQEQNHVKQAKVLVARTNEVNMMLLAS